MNETDEVRARMARGSAGETGCWGRRFPLEAGETPLRQCHQQELSRYKVEGKHVQGPGA